MPTAYFSGTFAPTTLLQVKAAIQGFSHVGLLYRNYSILLDIQSRFISRPNILTLEYACLCVCVCVCEVNLTIAHLRIALLGGNPEVGNSEYMDHQNCPPQLT